MSTCGKTEPHRPHLWVAHFDEHEQYQCFGVPVQTKQEVIDRAVDEIIRTVGNVTLAWNLWNNLNTSPDFKTAYELLHPRED